MRSLEEDFSLEYNRNERKMKEMEDVCCLTLRLNFDPIFMELCNGHF